jgi:hypothetical protein
MTTAMDTVHFSPYRADGKLYGFVCVVTGAQQPVGQAIIKELAGRSLNDNCRALNSGQSPGDPNPLSTLCSKLG